MNITDIDTLNLETIAAKAKLEEVDIDTLIQEDLTDLSFIEKIVYKRWSLGHPDKKISEDTGICLSTILGIKSRFYQKRRESICFALVSDMIFESGFPVKRTNKKYTAETMHPILNEDNVVIDWAVNKFELHRKGLRHASTVIIPAKIGSSGEILFFLADKKEIRIKGDNMAYSEVHYECCGGHVERVDGASLSEKLTDLTFFNSARREFIEEYRHVKSPIDLTRLHHLFTAHDIREIPDGMNNEVTSFYIYKVAESSENVSASSIKFRDEYSSSWLNVPIKKAFVSKVRSYNQLCVEFNEHKEWFSNALTRVFEGFNKDKNLIKKVKEILEDEHDFNGIFS